MSERQQSPYDSTARKWLALVERQQNFIELGNTGRWRHYYTHALFADEMRKVLHLRNQWARLAGLPASDQIEPQHDIKQNDRRRQDAGEPQINSLLRSGGGRRHRPASAILAAVAGRL
jgi:hypothetical protein